MKVSVRLVVSESNGHRTLESAEKEIAHWGKIKPSKYVKIVEWELH